jgi:predicted CopG family antitoxin
MPQKSKMISVSEKTYRDLAQRGTLEDTFDSVIQKLLKEKQEVVAAK